MSLSASSLPPGFSWLRPAYRPTASEVETYAHLIADAEGCPTPTPRLHQEAELQLWIWRTENRKRARQARRGPSGFGKQAIA